MTGDVSTCINNLFFEACHFNKIDDEVVLHGHTFEVKVCVRGELSSMGWVIDFSLLRRVAEDVVSRFKYALIVPNKFKGVVKVEGPFKVRYVYIEGNATAEVLARLICKEIANKVKALNHSVSGVEVWVKEGVSGEARSECRS